MQEVLRDLQLSTVWLAVSGAHHVSEQTRG